MRCSIHLRMDLPPQARVNKDWRSYFKIIDDKYQFSNPS